MGDEARCRARYRGEVSDGKALLETDALLFRGDFRLAIPLREIRSVEAEDGRLRVAFRDDQASFELGPRAERWAERIKNPKTLLDKLGVRRDARVGLVGVADPSFRELLRERGILFADGEPEPESDLIFVGADGLDDLDRLARLRRLVKANGSVWVVAPKGGREPRESDVLAAGKNAGLVDTKVVRFSETHTAHKFVIPVADR